MSVNGVAVTGNTNATAQQMQYFELSAAQMQHAYSGVSTAAIPTLAISPTSNHGHGHSHINLSSSAASSAASSACASSSSSCESGIVLRLDSAQPMTKTPLHADCTSLLGDRRSAAIMSGHAAAAAAAQITPKMLNDINMAESIHKLNQTQTHHQLLEQQQKVHQIPLSEDPRTLQLALELSLVGLNDNQNCYVQPNNQSDFELGPPINVVSAAFARTDPSMNNLPFATAAASGLLMPTAGLEDRSKKSQNMTECVPVPSSEHVAEIVGRQALEISLKSD